MKNFLIPQQKYIPPAAKQQWQCHYAVGLVDEQNTKSVLKNLIDSIYANNKALTAGDIGFHFLIKALDDGGASQLIYDMNNRDDVAGLWLSIKKRRYSIN